MNEPKTHLILAFDGSCGQCRQISRLVEQACEGKLEVRPLGNPDVRQWREQALGARAPWAPTLLRIEGDDVRAWVGRAMAVPLVRRLGLRSTVRVVRAFGRLRHPADRSAEGAGDVMGRKRFLQLGVGAAVVAGLAVTGQVPAFAHSGRSKSQAWVEANMDRLPRQYADFSAYPMTYRRQIYPHLPPETKRQLWLDHLGQYRETAARLTPARTAVLDRATTIVRDECTFTSVPEPGSQFDQTLRELREEAIRQFGRDEANALLITLGPVQDPVPFPVEEDDVLVTCTCSDQCHDNCPGSDYCAYKLHDCAFITDCCAFWLYVCNGLCTQ
ncbi:bacteriocin fulvocin C-related protein [Streptomyces sp. 4N124]|uniref:bacteriocin fulvocin C-related protein n=1 Tax=Streptomyces sp. 4N124 TaxID=3457420 RepID=UPI003FD68E49